MKRLFIALMAVCVMASCGGDKGGSKTPGDLMMMTVEMLNTTSDNLENAKTADQVIDALDKHGDNMIAFYKKYGKQLEAIVEYSDEEIMEKFATENAAAQAAIERFGNVIQEVMTFEFNDEQQERLRKVMEKMEDASY